jgi:hypothetical protein
MSLLNPTAGCMGRKLEARASFLYVFSLGRSICDGAAAKHNQTHHSEGELQFLVLLSRPQPITSAPTHHFEYYILLAVITWSAEEATQT